MAIPNHDQDVIEKLLQDEPEGDSVPEVEVEGEAQAEPETEAPEDESEDEPGPDESGEQGDESEDETEESGEEAEAEGEKPAEEAAETPEVPDPLTDMRRRLDESAAIQAKLVDLLRSQQTPTPPPKPAVDTFEDVPDELLRLAFMGGITQEVLGRYTPEQVRRTSQALEAHANRQVKFLRNPQAYLDEVKGKLDEIVHETVRPLAEEHTQRKANELADKFYKPLDKASQERFREVFKTLPGFSSGKWSEVERDVEIAAKIVRLEALEKQGKVFDQKQTAKKVQRVASGGGKLKGKPTGGAAPPAKGRPSKKDDESYSDYARRLKTLGY